MVSCFGAPFCQAQLLHAQPLDLPIPCMQQLLRSSSAWLRPSRFALTPQGAQAIRTHPWKNLKQLEFDGSAHWTPPRIKKLIEHIISLVISSSALDRPAYGTRLLRSFSLRSTCMHVYVLPCTCMLSPSICDVLLVVPVGWRATQDMQVLHYCRLKKKFSIIVRF